MSEFEIIRKYLIRIVLTCLLLIFSVIMILVLFTAYVLLDSSGVILWLSLLVALIIIWFPKGMLR